MKVRSGIQPVAIARRSAPPKGCQANCRGAVVSGRATPFLRRQHRNEIPILIVAHSHLDCRGTLNPFRFNRFAARVLGTDDNDSARAALKEQLKQMLAVGQKELPLIEANAARNVEEGFGRLDAINRIGNQVFALDLEEPRNYAPTDAPVRFPHIWTAPWYTWVQYNGSIMQPMVRNAGESLGVRALVNLRGPAASRFDSTANIHNLYWIEEALAGKNPWAGAKAEPAAQNAKPAASPPGGTTPQFTGLLAPKWPVSTFPAIDETKRARGQTLYTELCQGCHLPPPGTPAFWASNRWVEIQGNKYLDLKQIPLADIGTDPAQAKGMATRTVVLPPDLPLKSNKSGQAVFANALGDMVENVANFWYKKNNIPAVQQDTMNGSRPNHLQIPLEYKARTLDGVWAAGPYLHNGSVPTLYDLLSPREKRPTIVHLGGREYDPTKVGYRNVEIKGGFALDTTKPGNSNAGHEFRDGPRGQGVIGRGLSDDERWALIEFLKTL